DAEGGEDVGGTVDVEDDGELAVEGAGEGLQVEAARGEAAGLVALPRAAVLLERAGVVEGLAGAEDRVGVAAVRVGAEVDVEREDGGGDRVGGGGAVEVGPGRLAGDEAALRDDACGGEALGAGDADDDGGRVVAVGGAEA